MQTYFIYIVLFVAVLLVAKLAEITNNRKCVIFIIAIFSLVAGLRADTVGLDTGGYLNAFRLIVNGRLDLAYGMEWSFRYICRTIATVIKEPQIFLMIFAIITNSLIIHRLWEMRKYISFSWSLFIYYSMFYMTSLNLTRQFIAIAIVFYATKYIIRGMNINYLIWVFVASLFHSSALLGGVYIYFNIINWKQLNKRHKQFLIVAALMIPIVFAFVYQRLIHYSGYMDNHVIDIGYMIIVKLIIVLVSSLMLDRTERHDIKETDKIVRFSRCALIAGLLLTSVGYVFRFVDRIGLYFYIFETVYIGYIFNQKNTKNNLIIKIVALLIYTYIFFSNTLGNGQGQTPYLFFWQ